MYSGPEEIRTPCLPDVFDNFGGPEGSRTLGLPDANRVLWPAELLAHQNCQ